MKISYLQIQHEVDSAYPSPESYGGTGTVVLPARIIFYSDLGTSSNSDQISPTRYEYTSLIEASMVAQRPKNTRLLIMDYYFFTVEAFGMHLHK
ncbi:unnamed protein product [Urochloa humidicola]